jgi:hypothetical protein
MRALTLAIGALVVGVGGYLVYTKTKGSTSAQDDKAGSGGGSAAPRVLTPDQIGLVTAMLSDYLAIAPVPVSGCASATLVAGRKPAEGESVAGDDRVSAKAAAGAKGGDVYVDAVTVGAATLGTPAPGGVAITIVDGAACPAVVANLVAAGWFLLARKGA